MAAALLLLLTFNWALLDVDAAWSGDRFPYSWWFNNDRVVTTTVADLVAADR